MNKIYELEIGDIVVLNWERCSNFNVKQQPRSKEKRKIGIVTGYKYKDERDVVLVAWINGLKILEPLHGGYLKKIGHIDFERWQVNYIVLNIPVERD